ncbi:hypothetical protein [Photobacterium leiognathi]|uniref:hypothetical protein n=1 Tax=Photobacterium leiognathi TaxID=553611 RepID=UPI00298293D6|nr:hypothetical protein [Photobacterium leiognathi]
MKKLIIPTLIMSAFAGSNAMANPMDIQFQGNVIKNSSGGVHWYSWSRPGGIKFADTIVSSNPDQSADYVIHPKYTDVIEYVGGTDWQNIAMMTTNTVYPHTAGIQSMPFKPVITMKVGDEPVNFDTTGSSTNAVTYQDASGVKVTWAPGDLLEEETGIAFTYKTPTDTSSYTHQMLPSIIGEQEKTWDGVISLLKYSQLVDKAFGSDKTKILSSKVSTYKQDFWNDSKVPKIGGAEIGYDFVKFDNQYFNNLPGTYVGYSVQRWFSARTPTVTLPAAAFSDGKATYQATISITSASV